MSAENRSIAKNKKAYHDYFVDETFECGIELTGTEVFFQRFQGSSVLCHGFLKRLEFVSRGRCVGDNLLQVFFQLADFSATFK